MNDFQREALLEAINWVKANYEPTAIIASGSIVRGNPNQNSDFDIYVIHNENFRQRVQKFFNSVPCEIFINNLTQVYKYFESERKANRPVTAHIIATGKLMFSADNAQIEKLLSDAKNFAFTSVALSDEEELARKYLISNLFEDASDLKETDPSSANYVLDKVMQELISFIFQQNLQPLPRIKERLQLLVNLDPKSGERVKKYYESASLQEKFKLVEQLLLNWVGYTTFFEWSSSPC